MKVALRNVQAQPAVLPADPMHARDACGESVARAVQPAVEKRIRSKRLAHLNRQRDRPVRVDLEMLRPNAELDRSRNIQIPGAERRAFRDRQPVVLDPRIDDVHRGASDELRGEQCLRPFIHVQRGADLLHQASVHHDHPVSHRHRLHLIVSDVKRSDAQLRLQLLDLQAHLHPQFCIEVRQRLVE